MSQSDVGVTNFKSYDLQKLGTPVNISNFCFVKIQIACFEPFLSSKLSKRNIIGKLATFCLGFGSGETTLLREVMSERICLFKQSSDSKIVCRLTGVKSLWKFLFLWYLIQFTYDLCNWPLALKGIEMSLYQSKIYFYRIVGFSSKACSKFGQTQSNLIFCHETLRVWPILFNLDQIDFHI